MPRLHKLDMLSSTLLTTQQGCFLIQCKQETSRKLLRHTHALFNQDSAATATAAATSPASAQESTAFSFINANVIMVMAILLCALICAIIVNAVIRCVRGVVSRAWFEPEDENSAGSVRPCARERKASVRIRRKRAVRSLSCISYAVGGLGDLLGSSTECAICLSEFAPGERVRVLPQCGHAFHVRCIDRWLDKQSSCPTCRKCLFRHDEEVGHPAAETDD